MRDISAIQIQGLFEFSGFKSEQQALKQLLEQNPQAEMSRTVKQLYKSMTE